jgi:hypothetical protein
MCFHINHRTCLHRGEQNKERRVDLTEDRNVLTVLLLFLPILECAFISYPDFRTLHLISNTNFRQQDGLQGCT